MDIQHLDHFTLRTPLLAETTAFFEQVAGLQAGWRPSFPFDGRWLYKGERPVLHLAIAAGGQPGLDRYLGERDTGGSTGSGVVDHIAFRCTNLPSFELRLRDLGMGYRARTVPDLREHQVFVMDPNGLTIEFIFNSSEPASWKDHADYPAATTASVA
ncbi:VOC family protein [Burkholderia gladioli]|uniref:VOC family protein n=1 Tax=Burkholderia gladioli TaxID=28095 RepID=UPI0016418FD9|nr:VOC family protein [Burkholderia gladioli]